MKKLKMFVGEVKQHTPKTRGVRGPPCAVCIVPTIVLSARVVKHCEQTNNPYQCARSRREQQRVALHTTPM